MRTCRGRQVLRRGGPVTNAPSPSVDFSTKSGRSKALLSILDDMATTAVHVRRSGCDFPTRGVCRAARCHQVDGLDHRGDIWDFYPGQRPSEQDHQHPRSGPSGSATTAGGRARVLLVGGAFTPTSKPTPPRRTSSCSPTSRHGSLVKLKRRPRATAAR